MSRKLAPLAIALCLHAPALASAPQGIPYETLAQAVAAEAGLEGADPAATDVEQLDCFVGLRVGLFDLRLPSWVVDEASIEQLRDVALALVDLQTAFLDWLEPLGHDQKAVRADAKGLRSWIKSWRGRTALRKLEEGGADLLAPLGASESIVAAARRFGDSMLAGTSFGLERSETLPEPLILVPQREDFVALVCFCGWLAPDWRAAYWHDGIASWTSASIGRFELLALEYGAPGGDFKAGIDMNADSETGMLQQVVQLAGNALVDSYFGARVPAGLARALSINLVIDLYGECNTRVDGDLSDRRTEEQEGFIGGGASEGGLLPAVAADSRWREDQGADRFLAVLRAAQKGAAGRVEPGECNRAFELMDGTQKVRMAVLAPFLGTAAKSTKRALPDSLAGDYAEFLRAYSTCFAWWLRAKSRGQAGASASAFAELLQRLAQGAEADGLESLSAEVLGKPLSAAEPTPDDLEGEFLKWLSR